jgi:hypothetical protein
MAAAAVAPLSFLDAAAAPPTVGFEVYKKNLHCTVVRAKTRKLKCRWTLEVQKDLEAMGKIRFPYESIESPRFDNGEGFLWKTL